MKHLAILRIAAFALFAFVMIFNATGCRDAQSHQDKLMADWIGAPTRAVVAGWGTPDKVYTNGSGGHVLCYVNNKNWVLYNELYSDQVSGAVDTTYSNPNIDDDKMFEQADIDEYRYYRVFKTEADGAVYDYLWRGE